MATADPERLQVWRALLITHSTVTRALSEALERERAMPLPWFEVLNALQSAGGRVRVMDLAEHLVVVPSSLSRQLSRMEDDELIRRDRGHLGDGRSVVVVLTPEGRASWRRANTTYLRVTKKLFMNSLSDSDVVALQRVFNKVTGN